MGKFGTGHQILADILQLSGRSLPSTSDHTNGTTPGHKVDQKAQELFDEWLRTGCPFPMEEQKLQLAKAILHDRVNAVRPHMSTEIQDLFKGLRAKINKEAERQPPKLELICEPKLELEPAHWEPSLVPHSSDITLSSWQQLTAQPQLHDDKISDMQHRFDKLDHQNKDMQNEIDVLKTRNKILLEDNTALRRENEALLAEKKELAEKTKKITEELKSQLQERKCIVKGIGDQTEEQRMRSRGHDGSLVPKRLASTLSFEHSGSSVSCKSARCSSASSPGSALTNSPSISHATAIDLSINFDRCEESCETGPAISHEQERVCSEDVCSQELEDIGSFDSQEWHDYDAVV